MTRFQIKHRNPGKSRGAQHVLFATRHEAVQALSELLIGAVVDGFQTKDWEIVKVPFTPRRGP